MKPIAPYWNRLFKSNYSKTRHIENVKLNTLQAGCDKNSVLMYEYYSNLQAVQKYNPWRLFFLHSVNQWVFSKSHHLFSQIKTVIFFLEKKGDTLV